MLHHGTNLLLRGGKVREKGGISNQERGRFETFNVKKCGDQSPREEKGCRSLVPRSFKGKETLPRLNGDRKKAKKETKEAEWWLSKIASDGKKS